ncbi:DUF7662 domain-containing protein [Deinococcus roseus]|uniref:DUF7662 domain-containing protein n=1 Tax=Deinococcus roseus TaxID=392414 RepID=A0ABQ2D8T4_9DEIO|nr:hypothetical protein [Deinococcus roseus]GGJ48989.1 hypothetical protein GCM10008938_38710 [Deinococcus roseus]
MSKGSADYAPLGQFLARQQEATCKLTFEQIEDVLGFKLPFAARSLKPFWWQAKYPHVHAWTDQGWETERVDFILKTVTFKRSEPRKSKRRF